MKPTIDFIGPYINNFVQKKRNNTKINYSHVYLEFRLDKNIVISYEKYPDSILNGLSKVGGIIALLRISFFLNVLNHYLFDKKISREFNEIEEANKADESFFGNVDTKSISRGRKEGIQTVILPSNDVSQMDSLTEDHDFRERFTFDFIRK